MLEVLDMIASVVHRAREAFRSPMPEPLPPPSFSVFEYRAQVEANLRRIEDDRANEPLLPSVDYRTNPRPAQVKVTEREPTVEDLKLAIQQRGPRGDALRSAVLGAVILPKPGNGQDVRP